MAFRGNNDGESFSNRGNYIELLHLIASKDANLASHLASSTVFSSMSNRIQNDLIEAIADFLREDIKEELSVAPFVAVEVDETTDITNKAQLPVIVGAIICLLIFSMFVCLFSSCHWVAVQIRVVVWVHVTMGAIII